MSPLKRLIAGGNLLIPIIAITVIYLATIFALESTHLVALKPTQPQHVDEKYPELRDDTLRLELVATGLQFPTSMRFLNALELLVLQKDDGRVLLISDGKIVDKPVLQLNVASEAEGGLLGIAILNENKSHPNAKVFLYLTENVTSNTERLRNRVYSYDYDGSKKILTNQTQVLDLPGDPGPFHNGGKVVIGPYDGYLYAVIGDTNAGGGVLDNQIGGRDLDDKSVILRVNADNGSAVGSNPFYDFKDSGMEKLERYYAYGIRNSFGMDFDPISHNLWITENGPDRYDEINLVNPGFNSGWHKVMGPISRNNATMDELVVFEGSRYEDPIFSWYTTVGVTDIEFLDSSKLGEKYENNIFVGDINNGNLYYFEVNPERTGLVFHDPRLFDQVADPVKDNESREISSVILGEGFGRITDIETGPDGLLYILTYEDGKIYRIANNSS